MKASVSAVALAVCFTAFAALPARAQAPDEAHVRVPFSFIVGNQVLPAGHYSVTAEEDMPSVLFFRSADGLHTAIVDTEWGTSRVTATPTLRFALYGTTHFLTGVRIALGAQRRDILGWVLGRGAVLALAGVVPGIALAYVAGRLLEALLAGVTPGDATTFATAVALAVVMTLAGSLVPTLRAVRVDPIRAIRQD